MRVVAQGAFPRHWAKMYCVSMTVDVGRTGTRLTPEAVAVTRAEDGEVTVAPADAPLEAVSLSAGGTLTMGETEPVDEAPPETALLAGLEAAGPEDDELPLGIAALGQVPSLGSRMPVTTLCVSSVARR